MGFDINNIPQFNLSYANNMLDNIQRDQEEQLRAMNVHMKKEEKEKHRLYRQLLKLLKIQLK